MKNDLDQDDEKIQLIKDGLLDYFKSNNINPLLSVIAMMEIALSIAVMTDCPKKAFIDDVSDTWTEFEEKKKEFEKL